MSKNNPRLRPVFLDAVYTTETGHRRPVREPLSGYAKTWEDVESMITDYAEGIYEIFFADQWSNRTQLRALCLEAFLQQQGHDRSWTLRDENTEDTPEAFIVNLRHNSSLGHITYRL